MFYSSCFSSDVVLFLNALCRFCSTRNRTYIQVNTPATDDLSSSNEEEIFRFRLEEPGSLQVKFEYPSNASNYSWTVSLYGVDSDNRLQELQSSDNEDSTSTVNATKTMYLDKSRLPAGDYYILVALDFYYNNGDYTVTALSDIVADVPASWAKTEVEAAINKQLVPKDMQNLYAQNINRKDFCYLVTNLITIKTGKNINEILVSNGKTLDYSIFSDTNDSTILAANALGIVNGKGNNKFDPNGYITRQEAAVMLQRTANVLGFIVPNGPSVDFADKSAFSSWAVNGIAFASAATDKTNGNKVMGGTGNNNFTPQGTYTRQQAFITMIRLFNALD